MYLDDVCIWPKTDDPLEHLAKVEAVLASLREHSLIAKGSKCEFFRTEMEFLGFVVGKDGVRPVPGKVEAVQQVPAPETVSQFPIFCARFFEQTVGPQRGGCNLFTFESLIPSTDAQRRGGCFCGGSVGRRHSAVCIVVGLQRGGGGGRQLRGIAQAAPKTVRGREYTIGGGMLATR